ncbi:MAG: hypothetical protein IAG10_01750, partial [Planctomycetaceae bacterium]|nr:hypothetical protein [Planctomycetaceae bacterium]
VKFTFSSGQTTLTLTINVKADWTVEATERFRVTLHSPTGASLGTATAEGRIVNDDSNFSANAGFPASAAEEHRLTPHPTPREFFEDPAESNVDSHHDHNGPEHIDVLSFEHQPAPVELPSFNDLRIRISGSSARDGRLPDATTANHQLLEFSLGTAARSDDDESTSHSDEPAKFEGHRIRAEREMIDQLFAGVPACFEN